MLMNETAVEATQTIPGTTQGNTPELSLQEIAALLSGRLPASKARSCLDQLPFLPVRNTAMAN